MCLREPLSKRLLESYAYSATFQLLTEEVNRYLEARSQKLPMVSADVDQRPALQWLQEAKP
jgi:hypothetical protein